MTDRHQQLVELINAKLVAAAIKCADVLRDEMQGEIDLLQAEVKELKHKVESEHEVSETLKEANQKQYGEWAEAADERDKLRAEVKGLKERNDLLERRGGEQEICHCPDEFCNWHKAINWEADRRKIGDLERQVSELKADFSRAFILMKTPTMDGANYAKAKEIARKNRGPRPSTSEEGSPS